MPTKPEDIYPVGTVVRLKKTGEFAIITDINYVRDNQGFLHYLGLIEGRGEHDKYCLLHDEVDLEVLPKAD